MKCVLITIVSSKINEVTKAILSLFIQKLYNHKTLTSEQKMGIKTSKEMCIYVNLCEFMDHKCFNNKNAFTGIRVV